MSHNRIHVPDVSTGISNRQYPRGDESNSPDWEERLVGYAQFEDRQK